MLLFRASLRRIPGSHAFRCGALGAEVGCPAVACIVVSGASGEFGPTLVKFLIRRGDKVAELGSPRSAERLRGLQALLPAMIRRGAGSIVVMGSQVVERPWKGAGAAAYTAAKSAVVALARAVAAEVASKGIRVNAVMPSVIDTAANRAAMPKADPKRWVSGESLAETIGFLLSDAAKDISVAALAVYGQ